MDTANLKERLLAVAKERLKARPLDYWALADEVNSPVGTSNLEKRLVATKWLVEQTVCGPGAWNEALSRLVDSWVSERKPADIQPLNPPEIVSLGSVAAAEFEQCSPDKSNSQKQRAQETRILDLVRSLGHDPLTLPARSRGKAGVKADVKKLALAEPGMFTESIFKSTWERLRSSHRLRGGA